MGDTASLVRPLAPGTHCARRARTWRAVRFRAGRGTALDAGALAAGRLRFPHAPVVRAPDGPCCSPPATNWWNRAERWASGQIYDSNRSGWRRCSARNGARACYAATARGHPRPAREAPLAACDGNLVLTSGGVSAGEADFPPRLLQEIGRDASVEGAHEGPGMPLLVARPADVCCAVCRAILRPAWRPSATSAPPSTPCSTCGAKLRRARPAIPVRKRHARVPRHLRAQSRGGTRQGTLWVTPLRGQAGIACPAQADCPALIPEDVSAGPRRRGQCHPPGRGRGQFG